MFNGEYDIALHEMQGYQASSPGEGYVSGDFSSCGRNDKPKFKPLQGNAAFF